MAVPEAAQRYWAVWLFRDLPSPVYLVKLKREICSPMLSLFHVGTRPFGCFESDDMGIRQPLTILQEFEFCARLHQQDLAQLLVAGLVKLQQLDAPLRGRLNLLFSRRANVCFRRHAMIAGAGR